MATVTGKLTDFGAGSLNSFQPQIHFIPSGPGFGAGTILATKAVVVIPDTSGNFTVNLVSTDEVHPARWYSIIIKWLDGSGNFVARDFLDWRLNVPSAGGEISSLVEVPANPGQVWIGLTPPDNPTPGTWWLVADPNNPNSADNTGDLYEWS